MADQYSSNAKLAKDYLWVKINTGESPINSRVHMSRIEQAPFNIADFFYQHGRSLAELHVPGIGKRMRPYLERILADGREKTAEAFNANFRANVEAIASLRPSALKPYLGKNSPEK